MTVAVLPNELDSVERESLVSDGFSTVKEAAAKLKLCRASVYKLMDSGELQYAKFGSARRIPVRALIDFAVRSMKGGDA